MATNSTETEIRDQKVAAMGQALGELHFLLWKDLSWLHLEWRQYRELFGIHESRIDLMNETAPRFFWSLERILWQDILLSLSRLSDPPGTGGQQNLTFRRFPRLVTDTQLRAKLDEALNVFEAKTQFARDWRHRRYAHRALTHAVDASANPLAHASRANVEEGLEAARGVMNLLEGHFQNGTVAYEHSSDGGGGASSLLWYLDAGRQAEERRHLMPESWRPRYT